MLKKILAATLVVSALGLTTAAPAEAWGYHRHWHHHHCWHCWHHRHHWRRW